MCIRDSLRRIFFRYIKIDGCGIKDISIRTLYLNDSVAVSYTHLDVYKRQHIALLRQRRTERNHGIAVLLHPLGKLADMVEVAANL